MTPAIEAKTTRNRDALAQVLLQLAAQPGKFQAHAGAALRFRNRRVLRESSLGRCGVQQALSSPAILTGSKTSPAPDALEVAPLKHVLSDQNVHSWRMSPPSGGQQGAAAAGGPGEPGLDSGDVRTWAWPAAVLELLEPVDAIARCLDSCQDESSRAQGARGRRVQGLRLLASGCSIPHPEKAHSGGADSHFVHPEGACLGVADGVGEWEWRFKCNPRAFADELMFGCKEAAEGMAADNNLDPVQSAMRALRHGYEEAQSIGSSTALVAVLNQAKGLLGVANLGDSTLLHLRREQKDRLPSMRCVGVTQEQQHSFNFPFQLSCMPTEADFPRLIQEGKHALVQAVRRSRKLRQDLPEDAAQYLFQVQEGDLLIIGTDGLFDNLHRHELQELASQAISPFEAGQCSGARMGERGGSAPGPVATDPRRLAQALAQAAFHKSQDVQARSPFSLSAQKAGLYHVGGKMDDITCVCAWVVRAEEEAPSPGAGPAKGGS